MGKPRSGNNKNNVRFSRKVTSLLQRPRPPVNVTGEHGKPTTFLDWLVGDSGAGCSVICNASLLTDIRYAPNNKQMRIHCNSGVTKTDQVGDLEGYGQVWYNPQGIANIISLGEASKRHRITMDTNTDNAIYLHRTDGTMRRFR